MLLRKLVKRRFFSVTSLPWKQSLGTFFLESTCITSAIESIKLRKHPGSFITDAANLSAHGSAAFKDSCALIDQKSCASVLCYRSNARPNAHIFYAYMHARVCTCLRHIGDMHYYHVTLLNENKFFFISPVNGSGDRLPGNDLSLAGQIRN